MRYKKRMNLVDMIDNLAKMENFQLMNTFGYSAAAENTSLQSLSTF